MNTHQHLMDTLVDATCREFSVSPHVLLGRSRADAEAKARHALAAALRSTGMSYPQIGRLMMRNHETAMHSCKVAVSLRETERLFAMRLKTLEGVVNEFFQACGQPAQFPLVPGTHSWRMTPAS